MTKVFVARPPPPPQIDTTPPKGYQLTPEAKSYSLKSDIVKPLEFPIKGKGLYMTDAGASFDFELNILDSASKRPIRAVLVESGLVKGFTDRLGRIILHLPRGANKVVIDGKGYIESGSFTPESVSFEPITLDVDLDSDAIYSVFSTGEVLPGERKILDNPGHGSGSVQFSEFLSKYWWALALTGVAGVGMYFVGKSKN